MTSVSKNVYIDKLADIVNKYSNTYHSTIKINPADVESSTYIDCNKNCIKCIKTFLEKVALQVGLKKFLRLKKFKILCRGYMLLVILTVKKLLERFTKKDSKKKKKIKKSLESKN